METGGHIITGFNDALVELKETTISMGTNALANIDNAITGLLTRNKTLCNQSIADDDEEDRLEMEVDRLGMSIIEKYRPLATDLRMVIASMKIASNLERISDHAVSIAKRARKMLKNEEIEAVNSLQNLYQESREILSKAIQAYADGDLKLAMEVIEIEKEVAKIYKKTAKNYTKLLETDDGHERDYLDLVFISRYLDRVGGLATNIAEDVVFTQTNYDIRHGAERPNIDV